MALDKCGALNQSGTRCQSAPSDEPGCDGWRCAKHIAWHETASKEEHEKLALIEIMEAVEALGPYQREDLDTRRPGMPNLWC